jgi:hypothetical protein
MLLAANARDVDAARAAGLAAPMVDRLTLSSKTIATIAQGPAGVARSRLVRVDKPAADRVRGVTGVIENPHWVAVVANTSWAAIQASKAPLSMVGSLKVLAAATWEAEEGAERAAQGRAPLGTFHGQRYQEDGLQGGL